MIWLIVLVAVLAVSLVCWAMWREDFAGMRTESQIRARSPLSFDDFYATYYGGSEISPALIRQVLELTTEQFGIPGECIRPTDNFLQTTLGDSTSYIDELFEEFKLPQSRQGEFADLNGTFDNIVHYISNQMNQLG